jgi:hypothetical protein
MNALEDNNHGHDTMAGATPALVWTAITALAFNSLIGSAWIDSTIFSR